MTLGRIQNAPRPELVAGLGGDGAGDAFIAPVQQIARGLTMHADVGGVVGFALDLVFTMPIHDAL